MPDAQLRGTTIHYEQSGAGPNLLFVHGMCGDARVWETQVGLLRDRFACTTYDRRGHSRSPRGDAAESDATHADDAAALIDILGLEPVVVVASSGGARISVELLRRRPEVVAGAVLSEPPLLSLDAEAAQVFLDDLVPRVEQALEHDGPPGAVDAFFSFVCPGLWSRIDEQVKDRYRANAPAMLAELSAAPNRIAPDDLAGVRTPALVLRGTDSHPTLRQVTAVLAGAMPRARAVELEDCGHVTYAEQPERFAAEVAAFAQETLTPATRT